MQQVPLDFATAEQVWDRLREEVTPAEIITLPLAEALGAYLARDARVAFDYPPFDRAVMDGYAVQAAALADGTATLPDAGLVRAGDAGQVAVTAATCRRINTGAPLPDGADAVVMVEKTERLPDGRVVLTDTPSPGQHIERRAALRARDDLLVRAGTRVLPGTLAALVAGGLSAVAAFTPPRVALLSTGDELAPAGSDLGPGQIHDSNRWMLERLVAESGGETVMLERAPDEPGPLRERLAAGLAGDVLIVVGGMSKGSHDLVPETLEQLGVEWLITSLNLKPGKPTRIGRVGRTWVFGLPGNPVSAAVCFLLFARPVLAGLQGAPVVPPPVLRGVLTSEMPACGKRPMYQPAAWESGADGSLLLSPIRWSGSGDPFGMATATALIHRPAGAPLAPRGETTLFHPIGLPG